MKSPRFLVPVIFVAITAFAAGTYWAVEQPFQPDADDKGTAGLGLARLDFDRIIKADRAAAEKVTRGDFDAEVKKCVIAMAKRRPAEEAQADVRRGETRFLFSFHNGVVIQSIAEGVLAGPTGRCAAKVNADFRALPFPEHALSVSEPGNHCCDRDPPRTACGTAIDKYLRIYNAEMARVSPASIGKYCS